LIKILTLYRNRTGKILVTLLVLPIILLMFGN